MKVRKVLFSLLAAGALLVAVPFGIGAALPVGHVASRSAVVAAPPAEVFQAIVAVERYAAWRPSVERVEVLASDPTRWRERSGGDDITFEMAERHWPKRIVTRIADESLPFGGTWTFDLAPEGNQTRVTITENGQVFNPAFRFISRFVMGHTSGIETYLSDLAKHLSAEGG